MIQENKELPYGADLGITFAIVETIGRSGRMTISDLYKQINAKVTPTKSYGKKMAEFLGLIQSNGSSLEITEAGKLFLANKSELDRKKFLANNLPKKYWKDETKNKKGIRQAIVRNKMEDKPNPTIYDWMLNNFANFGDYIGVLKYIKGQDSRCQITPAGIAVLNMGLAPVQKETEKEAILNPPAETNPKRIFYADIELDGKYPIRIMSREGKPFDWDIHNEEDWTVVEAALEAMKRRWKNNNSQIGPEAGKTSLNLSGKSSRDNSELAS